uniref:Histonelysine Nmethyltransferase putative n=1 Tax=Albugo laibachii Nc14 TaxID=890382 RepID=F0WLN7_9STRA|nr:histonelysine Nmethyltransferase putative [Albugo laibachii Nc14]|eukprot:CCA22203.1 histonelysine Nmethyltransferase putative [Albugo laibachii Nc14]
MQSHWHNGRRQRSRSASPPPHRNSHRDWNQLPSRPQRRDPATYARSRSKSPSNHYRRHARWGDDRIPPHVNGTPSRPSHIPSFSNLSVRKREKRSRSRSRSRSRVNAHRQDIHYRNSQKYPPQRSRSRSDSRSRQRHRPRHSKPIITHPSYQRPCASPKRPSHTSIPHHAYSSSQKYSPPLTVFFKTQQTPPERPPSVSPQPPTSTQPPPTDPQQPSEEALDPMEAVSLEHLEAIRNVKIITSNEHLLSSSSRDQGPPSSQPLASRRKALRAREEEDPSVCYCTYPSLTERQELDEKASASDWSVMESLQRCNDVSCLNYATYVECSAACEAREFCQNKRLQQPEKFPSLEAFKTLKKGFGIRTKENIRQGTIVGEYVGEIIDQNELNRRLCAIGRHELNFYYLLLRPGVYIDARNRGSLTRFVNHSCDPNCKTEKWTVEGDTRIAVVALRHIEFGTELTFDYQWKSLGSRQLACHCNAANCSGFIGGKIDVLEDNIASKENGYFREPLDTERGDVLVGKRLRLPRDFAVSSFQNVIVRAFDRETNAYRVECMDEETITSLSLSEYEGRWHVFCPLEGLSTDQIEKQVFSIPKRRIPAPFPSKCDTKPSKSTISTSIKSRTDRPRHPNRLLTPQILVKGIPQRCSSRTLHQLMSIHAKTFASNTDPIESLELFFFPNLYGWALVTFASSEAANCILEKLDHRPLYDSTLSIQCVDREGVDAFFRAKERNLNAKPEATDVTDTSTTPDAEKALIVFGQRLHWLVPLKVDVHAPVRTRCTRLILWIAQRLRLEKRVSASAVMLFHRFLHFHSAHVDKIEYMAIGVLHIALKASGKRYQWTEFVNAAYIGKGLAISWRISIHHENLSRELLAETEEFRVFAAQITSCQCDILDTLRYDIYTDNVYAVETPMDELLLLEAFQSAVWMHFPVDVVLQALHCISDVEKPHETKKSIRDARQVSRCLEYLQSALVHHWTQVEASSEIYAPVSRQEIIKLAKECVWNAQNLIISSRVDPLRCDSDGLRWRTRDLEHVERIRKRGFLARIDSRELFLQPWPYRSGIDSRYGVPASSLMELDHILAIACENPTLFAHFLGIVFPSDGVSASMDLQKHYVAFRQPKHTLASRLEAGKKLNHQQIRVIISTLLLALQKCHSNGLVHRSITLAHVFLYDDSVHVGGFHAMRKVDGNHHVLSDSERKEHLYGAWMHSCAPEVLLGGREFSWRADIWALGCVFLELLDLKALLLHGNSWTHQMDLIFRLCGTPEIEWKDAIHMSKYAAVTPKVDKSSRLSSLLKAADVSVGMIEMLNGMLQLNPIKRLSAEELLRCDFMQHIESVSFIDVEDTFAMKKKPRHAIRPPKKKRIVAEKTDPTPPLPTLLRHTSSPGGCTQQKPTITRFSSQERRPPMERVKLGWGMGLHSS